MRLVKSFFFLASVLVLTVFATNSYFSNNTKIAGNKFSTGTWEIDSAKVVINEVYYDVDSIHGIEGKNEWIELYNAGSTEVNLKNWSITTSFGVIGSNANKILAPSEFILLAHDSSTWSYWSTIPAGTKNINYGGSPGNWLGDTAETVVLKDDSGVTADQMMYTTGTEGHSWERVPIGTGGFVDKAITTPGM